MESDEDLFDNSGDDEEDWKTTDWENSIKPKQEENVSSPQKHDISQVTDTSNENVAKFPENKQTDSLMTRMELNDHKAGMEGLDKAKINKIIYEASKGSRFYENEKKKEEQMKQRIEEQRKRLENISSEQLQQGLKEGDALLEALEDSFDLSRTIVHVDMDAFYAAVEMKDDPTLRHKPMAVGGMSMLSTSNYVARKFGVRAAMPGFIALKLCPDLVIVNSNFDKYRAVSKEIRAVMAEYDPNYCPMSLDEAYLDFTEHLILRQDFSEKDRTFLTKDCSSDDNTLCICDLNEHLRKSVILGHTDIVNESESVSHSNSDEAQNKTTSNVTIDDGIEEPVMISQNSSLFSDSSQLEKQMCDICPVCNKPYPPYDIRIFGKDIEEAVNEMRCRIEQRTRLTASAGIAPNMMLSKVCSDKNKPNGQYRILPTRDAIQTFIKDLPIRKISGIGKVTEQMLNALNVVSCTDLYEKRALLYHLYSDISFNYFMRICLGIGSTTVERDTERKSMSTERTFRDMSKPADLYEKCFELSEALVGDLKSEELKGKTVTLKIKTATFEVKTRAHTLRDYTWDQEIIFSTCKELLRTEIQNALPRPLVLRLMGVRMSNLLHQSLCPKSKQNTISSFIKKMVYKPLLTATTSGEHCTETIVINDDSCDNKQLQNQESENILNNISNTKSNISTFSSKLMKSTSPKKISPKKTSKTVIDPNKDSLQQLFSKASRFMCPVCNKEIQCTTLNEMNGHVEKCLISESTISSRLDNIQHKSVELPSVDLPLEKEKKPEGNCCVNVTMPDSRKSASNESKPCSSSMLHDVPRETTYVCPVCSLERVGCTLDEFNFHVDSCLSQGAIKEILKEQKNICTVNQNGLKKKRTDAIGSKAEPASKKRKSDGSNNTKSIDFFFKS
ncbi:hypothetical protein SNE40_011548 [Patella caerulea]|uniref:DNA polymerase kappa n=1 Tax=Patella caerulea TaxID=87958 RepID=A0AAN8JNQ7_PATCE